MEVKEGAYSYFFRSDGMWKTHLVLKLLESEYRGHFEYIVIICPTLRFNKTYLTRSWIRSMTMVFSSLNQKTSCLNGSKYCRNYSQQYTTLFILDDVIADKSLDKRWQSLLDLAISGRHQRSLPLDINPVLHWYPKEPEKTGQAVIYLVPQRA